MKNCQQITKLISLSCEQKLPFKEQLEVKLHLMICKHCRAFTKNNQQVEKLLKVYIEK